MINFGKQGFFRVRSMAFVLACMGLMAFMSSAIDPALTAPASAEPAVTSQSGPTPYPDEKNEAAWPGKGVIRYFKWMPENRASFWSRREKDQGAVVFAGDSLTMSWPAPLLAEAFPGVKIANRGIGGDTSRGLLFRFKEDVLDLNPRAIMLTIGTNDLTAHGDLDACEQNISILLEMIRAQDPKIPVILVKPPPSDYTKYPLRPGDREDYNRRIEGLWAAHPKLIRLDLYSVLIQPDGKLNPEYFREDRVHLTPAGYQKWLEILKPAFAQAGLTAAADSN